MAFPTVIESFRDAISHWEGGWQNMPGDSGNYVQCNGERKLIGTMRGVTPKTLATYLGVDPCSISVDNMKNISLEDAARIGYKLFYQGPEFNDLEWSPLVWIAVDIGWGSGPGRGIKMLQALIGATVDGDIGPQTQKMYAQHIASKSIEDACDELTAMRIAYYESISRPGTTNHQFRKGWLNRAKYYLTRGEWWQKWAGWKASGTQPNTPIEDLDPWFDFVAELDNIIGNLEVLRENVRNASME